MKHFIMYLFQKQVFYSKLLILVVESKEVNMNRKLKKGYIQVYTGSGKGKTTAALGLALRAFGQGLSVCIVQFMKKGIDYGEYKIAKRLGKRFVLKQFGTQKFIKGKATKNDIFLANKGLDFVKKIVKEGKYNLVILDEINCALKWKLVKSADIRELLKNKHPHVELIFTGRYAPSWLIKKAHLVTEMKEKKHYFQKKINARCGIEY